MNFIKSLIPNGIFYIGNAVAYLGDIIKSGGISLHILFKTEVGKKIKKYKEYMLSVEKELAVAMKELSEVAENTTETKDTQTYKEKLNNIFVLKEDSNNESEN